MHNHDLQLLVRDLRTGRLNRRQAITRLAALGISASGIAAQFSAAAPQAARAAGAVTRGFSGDGQALVLAGADDSEAGFRPTA